jgi:hypothetical protein
VQLVLLDSFLFRFVPRNTLNDFVLRFPRQLAVTHQFIDIAKTQAFDVGVLPSGDVLHAQTLAQLFELIKQKQKPAIYDGFAFVGYSTETSLHLSLETRTTFSGSVRNAICFESELAMSGDRLKVAGLADKHLTLTGILLILTE